MSITTLTFVESEERYSVYRDRDGNEVYLAHGSTRRLVEFDDLNLRTLWSQDPARFKHNPETYLELVRSLIVDPDEVDEHVGFCGDCLKPDYNEELNSTHEGHDAVCDSCWTAYQECAACDEYFRHTWYTLANSRVCEGCRENYWSHCDSCGGYYPNDDAAAHRHGGAGCCEAPAQEFLVRNDGEPLLANDTRATVALPAGVISEEGMGAIAYQLRIEEHPIEERDKWWAMSYRLSELGNTWQAKEGNFTKRLSRFAYKEFALKVPPALLSKIGNIARDHSTGVAFEIETTRDLNLSAEEFAHEDSCWWQSYASSRCALKNNGGFGLRSFGEASWGSYVDGRAWVMPLRQDDDGDLTPTFETEAPDAFVVFNGYGELSGYIPARLVSHMAGMTYRKIGFRCAPMYINGDSGYLIAPEEIAAGYTDGRLDLRVDPHSDLFAIEQANNENEKVLANA